MTDKQKIKELERRIEELERQVKRDKFTDATPNYVNRPIPPPITPETNPYYWTHPRYPFSPLTNDRSNL